MKKHNIWKKFAAGLLALALVTGGLPVNVGGFLTGGTAIVAYALDGTAVTQENGLPTVAGTYYLNEDIEINSTWAVSAEITLDLNGHGIKMTGNSSVISVSNGGKLTITDSDATTTHYYTVSNYLATVNDTNTNAEGVKTFTGGYITGGKGTINSTANYGGGVYVNGGTLSMTGGMIIGNTALKEGYEGYGGGVAVANNGSFNMTGGVIAYNTSVYGGGVSCNGSTFEMGGTSEISHNNASAGGGGVLLVQSTFTMKDGIIEDNTQVPAQNYNWCGATGVQINKNAKFILQGGEYSGTTKTYSGGALQYGVTFDVGGLCDAPTVQVVGAGGKATKPTTDPTADGWVFEGWYKESACTTPWDFSTDTVNAATTLYAKWTRVTVIPIAEEAPYEFVGGEDAYISTSSGNVSLSSDSKYALYVSNGKIMLIELEIEEPYEVAELPTFFANTAYFSGAGTSDSPFVILPNQIYTSTFDSASIHPGDILAIGAQTALSDTVNISGDGTNVATYSNDTYDNLLVTATGLAGVKGSTESSPENAPTFTEGKNAFIFMGIDQINETDTYLLSQTTIFDILPASVLNLKYNGSAQTLITAGLSSTGATMKYSLSNVIEVDDNTILEIDKVKVGCVYHPTDSQTITFPEGYKGEGIVKVTGNGMDYTLTHRGLAGDALDISSCINYLNTVLADIGSVAEGDSIRVTKVDTDSQKIYYDFVKVSDYANCWGTDLPKGTDPGAYTVFYKMVKDALESEIDTVSVTIGKGVLDITAEPNANIKYDGEALDYTDFEFDGANKALAANAKVKELIVPDLQETLAIGNYLKKNTTYDIGALDSLDDPYLILPYTEGTYSFKLSERATSIGYYYDTENISTGKFAIDNDGKLIYTRGDGNGNWVAKPTTIALEDGKQWYCQLNPNGNYQIVQKVPDADIINVGNYTATITIPALNANYEEKVLTVENVSIGMGENGWKTAPTLASNQTYRNKAIQLIKTAGVPKFDTADDVHYIAIKDDEAEPTTMTDGWNTYENITANATGKYYIWYQTSSGDSWNAVGPELIGTVTISKYTQPTYYSQYWTLTMDSYEFDGTAHEPVIDGNMYGDVTYSYTNTDTGEELDSAPSAIGNYRLKIFAEGGTRYYSRTQEVTYSILNPIGTDGKADVAVYKDNDVLPESEGRIFAGWFTDSSCTTPYTGDSGKAYAKFIDEKVLTVKAQISGGTTANSEKTSIRFITSVDSLKYQNVGFKIEFNGTTIDRQMTKVYTAINASGVRVKPTVFSEDSKYMEAYTINQIPNSAFGQEFTVTPYYTTEDGTVVEGETRSFTIANMIK